MHAVTNTVLSDTPPGEARADATILSLPLPRPDRSVIGTFVQAIFKHADPDTFVSLRGFDQAEKSGGAIYTEAAFVDDLSTVIDRAVYAAGIVAGAGGVFAPPVCTFRSGESACERDVACGLALSVDVDSGNSAQKIDALEKLLGPATIIVASGGECTDPETGAVHDKLHAHWRLPCPTTTPEDHVRLADARRWAAQIIDCDGSAAPVSHPLRWPGSVHLKGAPRLARIVAGTDAEIDLETALAALEVEAGRLGIQLQMKAVQALPTRHAVQDDSAENIARFAEMCRQRPGAIDGTWHSDSRDLACEAVRCAVSCQTAIETMREHWVPKGTGFEKAGRSESWPGDVQASYEWALRQGEHGTHAVPDPARVFAGAVPDPETGLQAYNPFASVVLPDGGLAPPAAPGAVPAAPDTSGPAWNFRDLTTLQGQEIPPRRFIVDQWLSPGHVTLLYGDGGVGKSLLAMQLMTAAATGSNWCGMPVKPCRALGLFCEDDEAELYRRQKDINQSLGIDFRDLANMTYSSGVSEDNTLVTFDREGIMQPTAAYHLFCDQARAFRPGLIVVDVASDLFGGDENSRRQVKVFLSGALGRLAIDLDAAVLLTAHPSRSGMQSGSMDGGSTGWSNSARSRWALTREPANLSGVADPDARILSRRKANYAASGDEVRLRWQNGVFMAPPPLTLDQLSDYEARVDGVFLDMLNKVNLEGMDVVPGKQSPQYAPKAFARRGLPGGPGLQEHEKAMHRLFDRQLIKVVQVGRGSRQRNIIQPVPTSRT